MEYAKVWSESFRASRELRFVDMPQFSRGALGLACGVRAPLPSSQNIYMFIRFILGSLDRRVHLSPRTSFQKLGQSNLTHTFERTNIRCA
eukprot:1453337-Amphidinium_carterae.1